MRFRFQSRLFARNFWVFSEKSLGIIDKNSSLERNMRTVRQIFQATVADIEQPEDVASISLLKPKDLRILSDDCCFKESELILAPIFNKHILDQVDEKGFFKLKLKGIQPTESNDAVTTFVVDDVEKVNHSTVISRFPVSMTGASTKERLNVTISFTDLVDIDPINSSFGCRFRLYAFWRVNLHAIGMADVAEAAFHKGQHYSMSREEVELFTERFYIPVISVFNMIESEESPPADIRVYGGHPEATLVMWNREYRVTCKELFELNEFPFDSQILTVELRLNDPKTWDAYDLSVNCIQFHKQQLEQTEWVVYEPTLKRDLPKHKVSKVQLHIRRCPNYYLQNIIAVMFTLSLLGLLCFAMDVDDLGSRVSNILTLILTAVAFKFIVAQVLPRVPYNTLIDYYMNASGLSLALTAVFSIIPAFFSDPDTQVQANEMVFVLAVILILGSFFGWIMKAYWTVRQQNNQIKPISILKDKNWYAARFSTPFFLDPPRKI
eukprot:gene7098-14443_t